MAVFVVCVQHPMSFKCEAYHLSPLTTPRLDNTLSQQKPVGP